MDCKIASRANSLAGGTKDVPTMMACWTGNPVIRLNGKSGVAERMDEEGRQDNIVEVSGQRDQREVEIRLYAGGLRGACRGLSVLQYMVGF